MGKQKPKGTSESMVKDREEELVDLNNRRDTRLGTILGIVAILATLCTILFRYAQAVLAIFPENGYIHYILMWSVFVIPLSATLIICIDIIIYVVTDLNRYNIQNEHYKRHDEESDRKYAFMIKDFKIMLYTLVAIVLLFSFINSNLQNSKKSIGQIFVLLFFLIVCIAFFAKTLIGKKINRNELWTVVKRIIALALMVIVVIIFAGPYIINKKAQMDISFSKEGNVIIENAIDEDFGSASLKIYRNDKSLMYEEDILLENVLRAKESRKQRIRNDRGEEIGNAQNLLGEMTYWKYQFNISELDLADGKYYIVIDDLQEMKSVQIANMFEKEGEEFLFCKTRISKEY